MSNYRMVIKNVKKEGDPWVSLNRDLIRDYLTEQEIQDVITPYFLFVHNLPGSLHEENTSVIDGNTQTATLNFDSYANLQNAKSKLFGPDMNPVVIAKNALLKSKMDALGVTYTNSVMLESAA